MPMPVRYGAQLIRVAVVEAGVCLALMEIATKCAPIYLSDFLEIGEYAEPFFQGTSDCREGGIERYL